jgi:hypothetical protein
MTDTPDNSAEAVERLADLLEADADAQYFQPAEMTGLLPDDERDAAATLRALAARLAAAEAERDAALAGVAAVKREGAENALQWAAKEIGGFVHSHNQRSVARVLSQWAADHDRVAEIAKGKTDD